MERYLSRLDELSGGVEPRFWPVTSTHDGHQNITAIGYQDVPEPGLLLGFTYGLSLGHQEHWHHGRPELSICVQSNDPSWVLAIAYLAEQMRHDCPFSYGNTINFGEPISADSQLDGFVVFTPSVLDQCDATLDIGDDLPVNLVGMYPTYSSERDFINEHGLEAFWGLGWDMHDVNRPPVA